MPGRHTLPPRENLESHAISKTVKLYFVFSRESGYNRFVEPV